MKKVITIISAVIMFIAVSGCQAQTPLTKKGKANAAKIDSLQQFANNAKAELETMKAEKAKAKEEADAEKQDKDKAIDIVGTVQSQNDSLSAALLKAKMAAKKAATYHPSKGKVLLSYSDSTAYFVKSDSAKFANDIPNGFHIKMGPR